MANLSIGKQTDLFFLLGSGQSHKDNHHFGLNQSDSRILETSITQESLEMLNWFFAYRD